MTYSATKFEVATSNRLGGDTFTRRYIYKKIHYLTNWVKVTRNVAQYPLHHVTYLTTKFEVATSNGLNGKTFTKNVKDGCTDGKTEGRRTNFDAKLICPFFLKKKAGIKIVTFKGGHLMW